MPPWLSKEDLTVIKTLFKEKGWRGRRLVREFPNKGWTSSTIDRAINRLLSTGSIFQETHGAPRTITTDDNQAVVEEILQTSRQPGTMQLSQRQIATQLGISRSSTRRMLQIAAHKASQKMTVTRVHPTGIRELRVQRCQHLYRLYKVNDIQFMCFHSETVFTLDGPNSGKTDGQEVEESSLQLMVSCCVSWEGKTQVFFVNPQKMRLKSYAFVDHLERDLLPACERLYPDGDFILVLDGAASHAAVKTQRYLSTYAPRFIPAERWPPQSPDLNPMDYHVWPALQTKVYEGRMEPFASLIELSARITECWDVLSQDDIRKAISQWKRRLNYVVKANGEQITVLNK